MKNSSFENEGRKTRNLSYSEGERGIESPRGKSQYKGKKMDHVELTTLRGRREYMARRATLEKEGRFHPA